MQNLISLIPARVSAAVCSCILLGAVAVPAFAVDTHFWQQDEFTDFEKGNLSKISIRSDGRLFLAPAVTEIADSSTPYLWAVAEDSKGNVYAGGGGPTGSTAKLFEIDARGNSKTVAELPGLEIHAIAVDKQDRVYAATDPDGKIYRIVNGKPEVFFDPKAKYIWALAFSHTGDLFVATGDQGEIYRVSPDGHGRVFYKTEETHARSLTMDKADNLIVGTEPGGLVLRITQAGDGFVLYQAPKREVTAVAVGPDGSIYAAVVGNKSGATPLATPAITVVPTPAPATAPGTQTITIGPARAPSAPPAMFGAAAASIAGGSEVYRIYPDGMPRRVWSHSQDIAYALAFDGAGHPLVGTGNKGLIYRLDNDLDYTLLLNLPPTQVTAFATGRDGQLFAATGNIGKVYRIGPAIEKQGTYDSEAFDGGAFTYWGRLSYEGNLRGGGIRFDARSGNVNHPQKDWSTWSPVPLTGDGGRVSAPASRFLQYRLTLTAAADGQSPEVSEVDVAYLAKNVAPMVQQIEITPANYKFSATASLLTPTTSNTLSLPPLGQHRRSSPTPTLEASTSNAMQYAKGYMGVRWAAQDENGDTMVYKIEIRGLKEQEWKLLKDKIKDKYYGWDSTAFPDGRYLVRVTASDAPSNPPNQALSSELVSDPFLIDNAPPQIVGLAATPSGNRVEVHWHAHDGLSILDKAEYSVDGGDWTMVDPTTKLSDAQDLDYRLPLDHLGPGEHTIAVRVTDDYDNQAVEKVVVR